MEKYLFRIPSPMLAELRKRSSKTHITVSELIRIAIQRLLKKENQTNV